jgi:ribose-phosphate pyrophosphokinase
MLGIKACITNTVRLFGGDALEEMEECDCIDQIIVTNSFPIPKEKMTTRNSKLQVLDISKLLAEAIRRNHNGEAIGQLFRSDLYE